MSGMADGANTPYQDPGWSGVMRAFGKLGQSDGITVLRILFLSLLAAPFLILYVLAFIADEIGSPTGPLLLVIVAVGVLVVLLVRRIITTSLDATSADKAVEKYRSRFFLAFALNEFPLLLSFVLTFTEEEMWPYLAYFPFFLAGMWAIAPGKRNLEAIEQDLMQRGASFSFRAEFAAAPVRRR
jgi:hypothetical protein